MSVAGTIARPTRRALALLAAAVCATVGVGLAGPTVAHADPSASQLEHGMDSTWSKLETNGEKLKRNEAQLAKNEKKSRQLSKQIAPLEKKVDAMYKQVGTYAAAAYRGGNLSALNSMLKYGSPTTMLDQMATLDRMAADQHAKVAKYEKAKKKLDSSKAKYDKLIASNKSQAKKLAADKKKLQSDMATMQKQWMKTAAARKNTGTALPQMPYIPGPGGVAVRYAIAHLGDPYVWATAGPNTFDCSGLTSASWAAAGVHMRAYTYSQYAAFPHVDRANLQPGDLVFYNGGEHVAIYIGRYDGTSYVIHAPQPGEYVKVSPLDYPGSWYGAVRP